MDREEILKERELWYKQTFVLFEIVKCLKNRELCFLTQKGEEKKKAVRYLLGWNLDYWRSHFEWFNVGKSLLNVYHSVAVLKDVPVFSYNIEQRRKEEKYQEFDKNYANYVKDYALFIDIDGKENFELAYQEAKEIKKIMEEFKVPFYLVNSSEKGFHFCIEAKYMPNIEIGKLLKLLNDVVYNLSGIHEFRTIDRTIVDLKRVQKCPYSYVCTGFICLPLTDEQFANFTPEMVSMKNVLKNVQIKSRGLKTRTYGLSEEELKKNVLKFLDEYK